MEKLIQHIEKSITRAMLGKSKLSPEVLSIHGWSSYANRHLLNNLLNLPVVNYMEIGIFKGSTFISATYQNNVNSVYLFDNWSECADINDDARTAFFRNCAKFNTTKFKLFEQDCFTINETKINHRINVFFYDGNHSVRSTAKSLTYFYHNFDDIFIYIVDDYNWSDPKIGAMRGIKQCNLEILYERQLLTNTTNDESSWWNGLGIFILKKK